MDTQIISQVMSKIQRLRSGKSDAARSGKNAAIPIIRSHHSLRKLTSKALKDLLTFVLPIWSIGWILA